MRIAIPQPRMRALVERLLTAALDAVDPARAVARAVTRRGEELRVFDRRYDLRRYRRIALIGAGKASGAMAEAVADRLGDRLTESLVTVKAGQPIASKHLIIREAGHPVPDRRGQRAAEEVLALARSLAAQDLLIVVLSGGASSLWPAPAAGVTLRDKQATTQLLLRSGATIQEINTVRKHISAIKGGRLAAATRATVITLMLSDVIGDDVGTIGSGPTAPDPATYADAIAIVRRFGLWRRIPEAVRRHLLRGRHGRELESPKSGDRCFHKIQNAIIGNNQAAVDALAREAVRLGYHTLVLSTSLIGEAREAAKWYGSLAREIAQHSRPVRRPACIIAGGELTVTVHGHGQGGRAQEFALAAAHEIAGLRNVWMIGCGTDGTDGPTDAAGAVVNGETRHSARLLDLDPERLLRENDSYRFFRQVGGHIITGPTGTNVNDLYFLLTP